MPPEQPTTQPQAPVVRHIWCSVAISKKMEDVLIQYILGQAGSGINVSEYVVYLSTMGGSPFSAITLYNFFKSLPQKTTVYNMGNVGSAGVTFFLGFRSRIGTPDCSFMIHQTTIDKSYLPNQLSVFDLKTQIASLSATDIKTRTLIEKETKPRASKPMNRKYIEDAILKATTFHTDDAKRRGFIDKVELPTLPVSDVLYLTDQYLATLPGSLN
jgi:ATP-dependent protease ClpP protease subunit